MVVPTSYPVDRRLGEGGRLLLVGKSVRVCLKCRTSTETTPDGSGADFVFPSRTKGGQTYTDDDDFR